MSESKIHSPFSAPRPAPADSFVAKAPSTRPERSDDREAPPSLTVAICTDGRCVANLNETLAALRTQTLAASRWNLLIVDNASAPPLAGRVDLAWHPAARIVVEPRPGIGHARQLALREFLAGPTDVLAFLDDDNVPTRSFLQLGLAVAEAEPSLGCWGGQLIGRFDATPPAWIDPFLKSLAVFPLEQEYRITTFDGDYDAVPPTAGMWLRRPVAAHHVDLVRNDPVRAMLGGEGGIRIGAEDMDLALGALDLGYAVARLPQLAITHIIPAERLTEAYIARLLRGIRAGIVMLEALRFGRRASRPWRVVLVDRLRAARLPPRQRRLFNAELDGEAIARRLLRQRRALALAPAPRE